MILDSGDMLFKVPLPLENEAEQLRLKARAIAEISGKLGLMAAAVGECDLASGAEFLKTAAKDSGFHLLASNVYDSAGKKPFSSHMIVDAGGIRVGIFGVTDSVAGNAPGQAGLVQKSPFDAAREEVKLLRPQCRFVVCLSHQNLQKDQDLAKQVEGIDLIVGGHSREMTTEPILIGQTVIVQAYAQGKYVGRLDLDLPKQRPAAPTWLVARGWPPPPGPPEVARVSATFTALDKSLGDDPAVAARLKKYQQEVAKLAASRPSPPAPNLPPVAPPPTPATSPAGGFVYWGANLCASCHVEQAKFWQGTAHATAIEILKKKGRMADVECIRCHTTGYGQPGGFDSVQKMTGYENVQCEACHGPGQAHGQGKMAKTAATEETCKRCHDKENSPGFNFGSMLPMMSCPKMKKGGP